MCSAEFDDVPQLLDHIKQYVDVRSLLLPKGQEQLEQREALACQPGANESDPSAGRGQGVEDAPRREARAGNQEQGEIDGADHEALDQVGAQELSRD